MPFLEFPWEVGVFANEYVASFSWMRPLESSKKIGHQVSVNGHGGGYPMWTKARNRYFSLAGVLPVEQGQASVSPHH